jgi:hypothetical protein
MAQDKKQLVDETVMEKMSVAPPDPEAEARGTGGDQPEAEAKAESGVADEDPLSAHPS